ncbi:Dicer-like protein 1, partial [Nowakowskiella sp. JEL0078]
MNTQQNPRDFQITAFKLALSRNVLVVLDTGLGKTLIAVLLIKHYIAIKCLEKIKTIVIFMVPSVPLVIQQAEYLNSQLAVKVESACGDRTN